MKITYARTGGETSVYDYDSDDLPMREVKAIEKAADAPLDLVENGVQAGGYTERLILLWSCMRRENPSLKLADLEKTVRKREITVSYDRVERAAMREKIATAPHLTDEERETVLALLDAEDKDDEPEPEPEAAEVPKGRRPAEAP